MNRLSSNVTTPSGARPEFDEWGVAAEWFFPSTGSRFCFNDFLVPQEAAPSFTAQG